MATVDEVGTESEASEKAEDRFGRWLVWHESVSLMPLGHGWDSEPLVLDWFGEGAADLLVNAGGGPSGRTARVYGFRGGGERGPAHYDSGNLVEGLDGLRLFCAFPNGADSRFDLVALGAEGLVLLRNQGGSSRPAFGPREPLGVPPEFGTQAARVAQMVAVDWDGDGLLDLLVGLDEMVGYWPDAERVPHAQELGFNQRGGHPGFDPSGNWRGRAPIPRVIWLRNEGRTGEPRFVVQEPITTDSGPLDLGVRPAPLAVAWGGPGAWELLVTDARGEVRLYRNFGGQRPPVLLESRTIQHGRRPLVLPSDRTSVVADDLDGDRRAELVFGTADGRVFAVHAGTTRDEAQEPVPLLQEGRNLWLGGHAVVTAGDLDGDGDLDLVVGDASGRLHLVRDVGRPGEHRYALPVPLEAGGEPFRIEPGPDGLMEGPAGPPLGYACPALVDWVGHGRLDLLVSGAGGEVFYLRNNGVPDDPRFDFPKLLRCEGNPLILPPRIRPAAADWTGAGRPDLIALDLQGFLCTYPRMGPTDLGAPIPLVDRLGRLIRLDGGFGLSGRCSLWAGPWTGTGQLDLLVGIPRSSRFVIPALAGLPLLDPDDFPTVVLFENQGRDGLVPRLLRHADGRPLVVGHEGCSPCGVDLANRGSLDLLIGSDDGSVACYRREELRW